MSNIKGSGNSNFAAELLLNKIMNGQYVPESGKTITLGGRLMASELNNEARILATAKTNIDANLPKATQIEARLTELYSALQEALLTTNSDNTTNLTATNALLPGLKAQLEQISKFTVNGKNVFSGTEGNNKIEITIGLGETITLGGFNLLTTPLPPAGGDLKDLYTNATSSGITTESKSGFIGNLKSAITKIAATMAQVGLQTSTLEKRTILLDDLATTYTQAANNQFLSTSGGVANLVKNIVS